MDDGGRMPDAGCRMPEDGGQKAENLNGRHDGRSKWCEGEKVGKWEGGDFKFLIFDV